jgi:hypothetical protein
MASIRCAHCKARHASVAAVKACATTPAAIYTDARIAKMLADPTMRGDYRAAGYLVKVADPAARDAIVDEATAQANMIGGRWADAVELQVTRWLAGNFTARYTSVNSKIIASERVNPGTIATPQQFGVPTPRTH